MPQNVFQVIRPIVRVASRVAPRMVGNLAFRAFCVVPRRRSARSNPVEIAAEARMGSAEALRVRYVDGDVQTYRFRTAAASPRGTVLLVHGWTGKAAHMSAFVAPLMADGFDVVAVDLPGHGRSSGRTLHIPKAVAALHAVHDCLGPWSAIVAHSLGGPIVTAMVAGSVQPFRKLTAERLVLIAVPHSMAAIFGGAATAIGLSQRSRAHFEGNVLRLAGRRIGEFETARQLKESGIPTLLLHAPDDREVPVESAHMIEADNPSVAYQPLPGLGHRRIIFAAETVDAVRTYLSGIAPVSSQRIAQAASA